MSVTDTPSLSKKLLAGTALTLTVLSLLGGIAMGTPFLFWAYHIHQAGAHMEQGLVWPEPRYSDALPSAVNAQALSQALAHLRQAARWRPEHFHSYRLQAQVHTALGQWREAETNIAHARLYAMGNPLVHLDAVVIYEQIMTQLTTGSHTALWPSLITTPGALTAPALDAICTVPVNLATCDFLYAPVALPLHGLPPDLVWEAPYLGLRGDRTLTFNLAVPTAPSALSFLLGLHPDNPDRVAGTATLTISVRSPDEPVLQTVHEFTFAADHSNGGWIPGAVELTPWAGTTVEVQLAVDAPDQHVGWGQLTLGEPETAMLHALTPDIRWQDALRAGEFRSSDMETLIREAENRGIENVSAAWRQRADFLQSQAR